MKTLMKIGLVTAISTMPFAAQAELKALNDAAMGAVTGQAGVTIDLSANVSVKEIAYQDQGFLVIDGLKVGGSSIENNAGADGQWDTPDDVVSALDDIRLTIDVAGSTQGDLGTGGEMAGAAVTSLLAADPAAVAAVETEQAVSDGDLVISLRSQSGNAIDYGLGIGKVSLAKETGNFANIGNLTAAAEAAGSTVLVSEMQVDGYLGPVDIIIQEEAKSLNINAYFNADGEMTLPFMGTTLGFELHNRRGESVIADAGGTQSFAHAQVDVTVKEGHFADGGDALAVNVQDFSGDLDLTGITMGNGASIGSVYMTDLSVTAETVIYGH